ncbi:orotidine-5'-phosphate decarboxylase [Pontimonas sp.]|uniref:orotidine-5'-phosphate decarboxylase n=1 Tax=Pontimonas sp. TaxID=2304492 RepID=UPI0028708126|nr:orotidine-5'-phosphate decarboxylase [Pontimonas sp.]MDR9396466.1 orotidine-5'-phosphate decarboxylase [Pontimonas sp.]
MSADHSTFAQLLARLETPARRLCVGIDPHPELLSHWGLDDSAAGSEQYATRLIDAALESGISLMKPQVALFERHGVAGMRVLAQLMGHMRTRGMAVIADAKRGDIGTSLSGYASAWLAPGSDFEADALTLSPYLGLGALNPALDMAREHGKGVFVLAATSNPEGQTLQTARTTQGLSVAQWVLEGLQEISSAAPGAATGWLGAVVGATSDRGALGVDLERAPDVSVLAPGFGHQGARLSELEDLFGAATPRVIPTVSRSVAGKDPGGVVDRLSQHQEELRRVGS